MPAPQGFRHAAALLIAKSARAIPIDASPGVVLEALERLAADLAALAGDMHMPDGSAAFLTAELQATIDRLPQSFDRAAAKDAAVAILSRLAHPSETEPRDLFLIYVPEDRLPIAAPLAIALTKRRVSVAFAEYEVATAMEFAAAVARGLAAHRRGAVLLTPALGRRVRELPEETDRLRIIRDADRCPVDALAAWSRSRASEM